MIRTEIIGIERTVLTLSGLPQRIRAKLAIVIGEQTGLLFESVRANILAKFKQRTGRLLGSINQTMQTGADAIVGRVFSQGVPYARIHEQGGIVPHPGSNKFQAFMGREGRMVFTHFTRPHPIPIPERSYARAALTERRLAIVSAIRTGVLEEVSK